MKQEEIHEKIFAVIKEVSGKDVEVNLQTKLAEDLDLDAGEMVAIDAKLETEFGIDIPDDAVAKSETVEDIVNLVDSKINPPQED
jgi:acyl carrier protein